MKESANLDFLRSIAVLAVYASHVSYSFGVGDLRYLNFGQLGRMGVLLFFVHTSLVLMLSLGRHETSRARPKVHFYIRRIFRLYPLSIVCVCCSLWFGIPQAPWFPPVSFSGTDIALNLALSQNLVGRIDAPSICGPLWSLPYEVQMYLLLPFVFILANRAGPRAIIALISISAMAYILLVLSGQLMLAKLIEFFPCFLAGVLAFTNLSRCKQVFAWKLWPLISLAILLLGALLLSVPMQFQAHTALANEWYVKMMIHWVICFGVGALIPIFREIEAPWLRKSSHIIAKYSYGIYLSQVPAIWMGLHFSDDRWLQITVAVLLSALFPCVAYHIVEDPLINMGKRIADWCCPEKVPYPVERRTIASTVSELL